MAQHQRKRPSFSIRRARTDDARWLPAIERSAGELFATIPTLAWIANEDDLPVERHLKLIGEGTSWVATGDDRRILAFLCAEVMGDALHVWELSVALEHQRVGIGRALMLEAIGFAHERRLASVTLTTFRSVPWNEPTYLQMGFSTLAADEYDQRLIEILRAEESAGLPRERRCAMRLVLDRAKSA